jgi:hypothetical protein
VLPVRPVVPPDDATGAPMLSLEFTMPGALTAAFAASVGLPLCLLVIARLPPLAGRNAIQFLISVLIAIAAWAGALVLVPAARPAGAAEIAMGAMVIGSAVLVYLEIWSLLSRGYTLALIVAIHQSGGPLTADELARRYRGGEGLEWIMRHRLAGLEAAGLVKRTGDQLVLTQRLGRTAAWSYRIAIAVLGLWATG